MLVMTGEGTWNSTEAKHPLSVREGDFAVIHAHVNTNLVLTVQGTHEWRAAIVEVPTEVPYPLYPAA